MPFFTTPAIGTGTADDPIRPDVPEGTAWVGSHDPDSGTFLILVNEPLTAPGCEDCSDCVAGTCDCGDTCPADNVEGVESWFVASEEPAP